MPGTYAQGGGIPPASTWAPMHGLGLGFHPPPAGAGPVPAGGVPRRLPAPLPTCGPLGRRCHEVGPSDDEAVLAGQSGFLSKLRSRTFDRNAFLQEVRGAAPPVVLATMAPHAPRTMLVFGVQQFFDRSTPPSPFDRKRFALFIDLFDSRAADEINLEFNHFDFTKLFDTLNMDNAKDSKKKEKLVLYDVVRNFNIKANKITVAGSYIKDFLIKASIKNDKMHLEALRAIGQAEGKFDAKGVL